MKGIVLAGGTGSRLWPMTHSVSKQLIPVYDKPMIFYPISTLMLAGIREILIITTPQDQSAFMHLLGNGAEYGLKLQYAIQPKPEGLAQAFIIAEDFLNGDSSMLILGDNIFHGVGLGSELKNLTTKGAHIFTYEVSNPQDYGILEIDSAGNPKSVEEKPVASQSKLAITGLYSFDANAPIIAKTLTPSKRGELEITSLINHYLQSEDLSITELSRGTVWLDTGTPGSLYDATSYVRIIEERSGLKIACLEEIAWNSGWIEKDILKSQIQKYAKSTYGAYLENLI